MEGVVMPTDFQRLTADEQVIALRIAKDFRIAVSEVAAVIVQTQWCAETAGVPELHVRVCEQYQRLLGMQS